MFFRHGNQPLTSTLASATNPSTTTLVAEVTGLGGNAGANYDVRVTVGASTLATWWLEQCQSTALSTTALRQDVNAGQIGRRVIYTATGQSAQYVYRLRAVPGDLVRVRVGAAITAEAAATLQLEPVP